jgi:hypothetical protein
MSGYDHDSIGYARYYCKVNGKWKRMDQSKDYGWEKGALHIRIPDQVHIEFLLFIHRTHRTMVRYLNGYDHPYSDEGVISALMRMDEKEEREKEK